MERVPSIFSQVVHLVPHHKDPFVRVLIAQAVVEGLGMITLDREIRRYASEALRVVR